MALVKQMEILAIFKIICKNLRIEKQVDTFTSIIHLTECAPN